MTTKAQLERAIEIVNNQFHAHRNDDDQVKRMHELDLKCKGYSAWPGFDSYFLVTDLEKLRRLAERWGRDHKYIQKFREILVQKGGAVYHNKVYNAYLNDPEPS